MTSGPSRREQAIDRALRGETRHTSAARVVGALKRGLAMPQSIAADTDTPLSTVHCYLGCLKRRGIVRKFARGFYEWTGLDETAEQVARRLAYTCQGGE